MKLENFSLAIRVLKWIQVNPNSTIPQIKENFGIKSLNPPDSEEKNLYKVISFLDNEGFIEKIENPSIPYRGAHYFLKIASKGLDLISELQHDLIPQDYNLTKNDSSKKEEISSMTTEFSRFSYEILESLLNSLIDELPLEQNRRWFLRSKRSKLKNLVEKNHKRIQEQVSKIFDSLT